MDIMPCSGNQEHQKESNKFYNILWGENSSITLRLFVSLIFGLILSGIYSLWLFGTSRLEIDLENPKNDCLYKIYYSDGGPLSENKSKSKYIQKGYSTLSATFFSRKINTVSMHIHRNYPVSVTDVEMYLRKVRFSNGLISHEIAFTDKKFADVMKKTGIYLKYLGNGRFLITGNYPHFIFLMENLPKKMDFPLYPSIIIVILTISFFFLPWVLFLLKILFGKIELLAIQIINKTNLLLHDYQFWIYVFAIILLGWGFELCNFTFTIDDEILLKKSIQNLMRDWISQKRWGMAVVAFLTGNPTVPVIPLAITLICCFLSFCILFYQPNRNEKYFILPVYAVFPLLFQSFSFSSLNPGIGIGFLLSALSVYLINKRSFFCFLSAVMAAAFAIGSYEIFAVFITMSAVCWWLQRAVRHSYWSSFRFIRYMACKYILLAAGSFLLHKAILLVFNNLYGTKSSDYISNYMSSIKDFSLWFSIVSNKIWQYWSGSNLLFPKEMIFQAETIVICLIVIVFFIILKKNIFISKCLMLCGVVFLLVAPFSPYCFNQHAGIPQRVITLVFPLSLASIYHLTLVMSRPYRLLRIMISGLLVFISIQYLWNLNQNTYLQYMQNKHDHMVLSKLQNRISALPEFALNAAYYKDIKVVVIGNNGYDQLISIPHGWHSYPNWHSDVIGRSCLCSHARLISMLGIFHYPHYSFHSYLSSSYPSIIKDKLSLIESMPMWPMNGSIAFFDSYLVIKLSDHNTSYSKSLNRKLYSSCPYPINGAEELIATSTKTMRLLHTYPVDMKDSRVKLEGKNVVLTLKNKNPWFSFPARKFDVPYVVVEIDADFDQADVLHLWNNQPARMSFLFNAKQNLLKVRCPSYFLNKPFSIGFGSGKVNKVLLKGIKVYEDAQYTENLIRLNPELNKQKLMEILHE